MRHPIAVVGIGADGWDGLPPRSCSVISSADVVLGSGRQLEAVGANCREKQAWPSPLVPQLHSILTAHEDRRICVLASGDPMFHGIGVTLARIFGADRLEVHPAPSSASLACARLGWALQHTPVVSLVDAPAETLLPDLVHGRRMLILSKGGATPSVIAGLLSDNGFGRSAVIVLEQLGGARERIVRETAGHWSSRTVDPLNIVALDLVRDTDATRLTRTPGLPDDAYTGDGQMTKHEIRTLTLGVLAPAPGEVLWDVGGGSGTIAIEWMRTHNDCRATTFESSEPRRRQIAINARRLGTPGLRIFGTAPHEFPTDESPDAIFVGGGLTQPDMLQTCWDRLRSAGRIVANSVTAESDSVLLEARARYGGDLRKFQVYRAEELGAFTTWRPQLPVTQWSARKP